MKHTYRSFLSLVFGVSVATALISCGGGGEEVSEESTMKGLEAKGFSFSVDEYHRAAREGDLEAVALFQEVGMEVDAAAPNGVTALFVAAENGQAEVVSALAENGAQVNSTVFGGTTPLLSAATRGHAETVRVLLEAGADPAARDGHNWVPLTRAAFEGHSEVVSLLAPKSHDELDAALHLASVNGDTQTIDALLNAGASVFARSNENKTALMYAAANGNLDAVQVLLQNGSNRFAIDGGGKTSAQLAEGDGYGEVADYLLEPPTDEERTMPANPMFADISPERDEFTPGDVAELPEVPRVKNGLGGTAISVARQPIPQRIDGAVVVAAPVSRPVSEEGIAAAEESGVAGLTDEGAIEEGAFGEGDISEPEPIIHVQPGGSLSNAGDDVVVALPRKTVEAVAKKLKMHDYRESQLPVMLDDVVGDTATVRVLYGEVDAVEVKAGQQIAETGLEVVEVRRRFITSKQGKGDAVNVSEIEIRDVKSGERTLVVKDVPAKANDTYALMSLDGSGNLYDVRRDDHFAAEVPELGIVRFRVADVRPTQVVLEDIQTGESFTIPRTTYGL